jgi:hypothetical protein
MAAWAAWIIKIVRAEETSAAGSNSSRAFLFTESGIPLQNRGRAGAPPYRLKITLCGGREYRKRR